MSHLFVSYSSRDIEVCDILESDLEGMGFEVWRDRSDIRGGEDWARAIESSVGQAYALLVLVSRHSIISEWVKKEIEFSQIGEIHVIPLRLDDSEIPAQISDSQAIDFSATNKAKGAQFRKAYDGPFEALVRSLRRLNPSSIYLEQLHSSNPAQRADAVRALSNKPDANNESTLIAALRKERSEIVRFELTKALGKMQSAQAREPIEDLLADDSQSPDVRAAAATALGRIGDQSSIGPLADRLSDDDRFIRATAVKALGELEAKGRVAELTVLFRNDPIGDVRQAAFDALVNISGPEAERTVGRVATTPPSHIHENVAARTVHALSSVLLFPDPPLLRKETEKRIHDRTEIVVGCSEFTESRLMCAILVELLEQNLDGDARFGRIVPLYDLGGATQNFVALSRGQIDLYAAYTGTGFEFVYPSSLTPDTVRKQLLERTAAAAVTDLNELFDPYSLSWVTQVGFRNDWRMVIRKQDSYRGQGLTKLSDLRQFPGELTLGCEHEFVARSGGIDVLQTIAPGGYGLRFKDIRLYRHRDVYRALLEEEVDIIDGFTTDEKLNWPQFCSLDDDEHRLGAYHSVIVARKKLLASCPAIGDSLAKLNERLDNHTMSTLIQEADRINDPGAYREMIESLAAKKVAQILKSG